MTSGDSRASAPRRTPARTVESRAKRFTSVLAALAWAAFAALASAAPITVTSLADDVFMNAAGQTFSDVALSTPSSPAYCTLRMAILAANIDQAVGGCGAGSGADNISFTPSLTATGSGVIAVNSAALSAGSFTTLLAITSSLAIVGPTNAVLSISAGATRVSGQYRLMGVNDGADATLANVSIANLTLRDSRMIAQVAGSTVRAAAGGCLFSFENLTLTDVKFENCTSQGASDANDATNYSAGSGGALWVGAASSTALRPSVTLTRVSVRVSQALRSVTPYAAPTVANQFVSNGGGIVLGGRSVDVITVNDLLVENCEADNIGGLFVNNANTVSIADLKLLRNRAIGTTSTTDPNIDAGFNGGGSLRTGSPTAGTITLTNAAVVLNGAAVDRGGLEIRNAGSFVGTNLFISDNAAERAMGGLEFRDVGAATLTASIIARNEARTGGVGGLRARLGAASRAITIEGTAIIGNTALGGGSGGAQFDTDGQYKLHNSTIAFNRVGSGFFGGGLQVNLHSANANGVQVAIRNSTLARNEANGSEALGAFTFASSSPTTNGSIIIESTILGNRSGTASQNTVGASAAEAAVITYANTLVEGPNSGVLNQGAVCVGTVVCGADAKLLAWVAPGERPFTTALVPMLGSKALNAGSNSLGLTTDQRGLTRTVGSIDIGATEAQAGELPPGVCSLDMDGDSQVLAAKEGLVLLRALLGFNSAAAVSGTGISASSWDAVKANLNGNCGTNFAP